jgi:hypothetical protein
VRIGDKVRPEYILLLRLVTFSTPDLYVQICSTISHSAIDIVDESYLRQVFSEVGCNSQGNEGWRTAKAKLTPESHSAIDIVDESYLRQVFSEVGCNGQGNEGWRTVEAKLMPENSG